MRPEELILILDFGGQYTQLIARRVRECHVYCEIIPYQTPLEEIVRRSPKGLILSGGPASVLDPGAPTIDPELLRLGIPVLGICYGMQLLAHLLGGQVGSGGVLREYGRTEINLVHPSLLWEGIDSPTSVWMSHGDLVIQVPPGFVITASSPVVTVAAMEQPSHKWYGLQFHPEVAHTAAGRQIIHNFLFRVCGCQGNWTMASFIARSVAEIKAQVGEERVLAALSGGVDSSVAAVLVHRAVGEQLTCLFVNHGLLRQGEAEAVLETMRSLGVPLVYRDASERFLARLAGVVDPEEKRRRVGHEFIRVFEEEARRLGKVRYLVQGTLYPDVIESGTPLSQRIKSHHNVGGLPEEMELELLEPLRYLFKDEVRELGLELGLPEDIVWRQPFPGPGLAVRILGEVTAEKVALLRKADAIVTEEVQKAGLSRALWQYFAILPGIRTVGVMGDRRTYSYTVAVRAVESQDGMTADWARLPHDLLERIASRIVREVPEVNRVVYDITSKPPSTIEWE
ncbi:glutamine-hydrolyzing GMP synthase [Desulfothermobacter acidiphilus]|uniref:glutamine-hydrolyzing GMP synthase n=1 Tax=Desulfothermobacter acidiphilus TaxID=1938353 RepID=UPI003F897C92